MPKRKADKKNKLEKQTVLWLRGILSGRIQIDHKAMILNNANIICRNPKNCAERNTSILKNI